MIGPQLGRHANLARTLPRRLVKVGYLLEGMLVAGIDRYLRALD